MEYTEIFNEILKETKKYTYDHNICFSEKNIDLNRYSNIGVHEDTRVKLQNNNYFHANYVGDHYICTQGPKKNTIKDFWQMMYESKISVIVKLAKDTENGIEKCFPYHPLVNSPLKYENFTVKLLAENTRKEYIFRAIMLIDKISSRFIQMYDYFSWPDHGVPKTMHGFIELLKDTDNANGNDEKILVHCSAGIGRTGVYVCCHSVMKGYKKNIKEALLEYRKDRQGLIQNLEQYKFSCQVVDKILQK